MTIKCKGLLIDLDGTLYHGNRMVAGADKFIEWLQSTSIPYLFLTNNSSRTAEQVAQHLTSLNIPATSDQVYSTSLAAAAYILEQGFGNRVYMIGEHGLSEALLSAGLELVNASPDYVVQGIDRSFTYAKLTEAVQHIRNGANYILTNPDLLLPGDQGVHPGAGAISAAISAAADCRPVIIGKPSAIVMRYAIAKLGSEPAETWVVGDNMLTDIGAGAAAGCHTVLTLTGLTTIDNLAHYQSLVEHAPDQICRTLDDLRTYISSCLNVE